MAIFFNLNKSIYFYYHLEILEDNRPQPHHTIYQIAKNENEIIHCNYQNQTIDSLAQEI